MNIISTVDLVKFTFWLITLLSSTYVEFAVTFFVVSLAIKIHKNGGYLIKGEFAESIIFGLTWVVSVCRERHI